MTLKIQMCKKGLFAASGFLLIFISLYFTMSPHKASELMIVGPVFAQAKGGLSASSVNPNSTIGERTGNTTGDLMIGGTSAVSVTDGLTMTMSSGRTGNTTNLTSTEGGVSASSVNKAREK